jgi:hypothetical protein
VLRRREGFGEVFALGALGCFAEDELEAMLCGTGERWTVDKLAETIKCDHGCARGWGPALPFPCHSAALRTIHMWALLWLICSFLKVEGHASGDTCELSRTLLKPWRLLPH